MRVAVLLMLSACGTAPVYRPEVLAAARVGHRHELLASIRRTACFFGRCPVYTLSVFRDGSVEFNGEGYVRVIGHATGHLADAELNELDDLFLRSHYLDFDSFYETINETDMAEVDTAYSPGQGVKTVAHYHGDDDAPRALNEIEDGIDRIAHADQWIGPRLSRQP